VVEPDVVPEVVAELGTLQFGHELCLLNLPKGTVEHLQLGDECLDLFLARLYLLIRCYLSYCLLSLESWSVVVL
jgi:hypothetical protein